MVLEQHGQLGWIKAKARSEEATRREVEQQAENLQAELEGAREKVDEMMGQEGRMEEELAGRIEVLDKLRTTVREMERDKRETAKRYREQSESFDSERQSWYDQEQHYKTRISNLSTSTRKARLSSTTNLPKSLEPKSAHASSDSDSEQPRPNPRHSLSSTSVRSGTASPTPSSTGGGGPSANELALQDQLTTLTTAHTSLTSTLRALQTELSDLKRVYQDLQEENESYEVLLGERTLNGEVRGTDLFRRSFHWAESGSGDTPTTAGFGFIGGLEAVGEEVEELSSDSESEEEEDLREADEMDDVERVLLESQGTGTPNSGAVLARKATRRRRSSARHGREASAQSSVSGGGGMDLAAELEMADVSEDEQQRIERRKAKREKKAAQSAANGDRRGSIMTVGLGEDLRSEVRQLREANKALTLYVSKIVDRVCSQEGFEKVLAVDYRLATPKSNDPVPPAEEEVKKPRPSSGFFGLGGGGSAAAAAPTTPLTPAATLASKKDLTPNPNPNDVTNTPSSRKGISWEGVTSAFSNVLSRSNTISTSSPSSNPHMKPLRLGESVNARKLELDEDDEDIRARMKLHREMAQLGIDGPDGGNQWGHRSSLSSGSKPNGADAEFAPKDLDAEVTEENAPLAAKLALHAIKVKESDAKTELEGGRASGFTEPKRRRPGSMRSATSSSRNSVNMSVMGLGISDPAQGGGDVGTSSNATTPELGGLGPAFSPTPGQNRTPSPRLGAPAPEGIEGASPTWQKVTGGFKRLSRGLSISGSPSQSPALVAGVPAVAREPATPEQ